MWYLVEGDIKRGAGVTVNCELLFELPNKKSFWGTVVSDSYVDNGFYTVEDNVGVPYQCYCEHLRPWFKFSIAVGGVSNDKTHDHHYQQNFTEIEIRCLEYYLVRKRQEDVGKGKVKSPITNSLFLHMDNTSQNFKSTGAIEFVTHLFKEREMEYLTAASVIMFVFPGHGKGA